MLLKKDIWYAAVAKDMIGMSVAERRMQPC